MAQQTGQPDRGKLGGATRKGHWRGQVTLSVRRKMNKQIIIIRIIAGLMLILGLWNIVCNIRSIDEVLRKGFVGENIFIQKEDGSEAPLSAKDFLVAVLLPYVENNLIVMTDAIVLGPLLIIASIGLWRIQVWGLLTAMIALGAEFLRNMLCLLEYHTGYVKTGYVIEADGQCWYGYMIVFCFLILSIIPIVYLMLNKSKFGFTNKNS